MRAVVDDTIGKVGKSLEFYILGVVGSNSYCHSAIKLLIH